MSNQDLVFTSDEKFPDSWPEEFPGITNFSTVKPSTSLQFDGGDIALVNSLSNLASGELIDEIKTIYRIASELHLEEEKEKTRGKILRVLLD